MRDDRTSVWHELKGLYVAVKHCASFVHLPLKGRVDAHGTCPFTSPLRGEVAATRRVGATDCERHGLLYMPQVTPPRSFAPTLPLEGRVDGHATCCSKTG